MFYRNSDESGKLCIGLLRGDFGREGDRFWHNWADIDGGRKTPEFQSEFQSVMFALRQDILKDYKSMASYCRAHHEAKLPGDGNLERYGFKLETDTRQYFIRCTTLRADYFYIFAYDKAPALELERPKAAMVAAVSETRVSDAQFADHTNGADATAPEEKPSVIKQIREAQKAPKPPRKEKTPDKHKGDVDL